MGNAIDFEKAVIGIELGSTRIKAVMTDECGNVLASGASEWENKFENGIWTYSQAEIDGGLRACYSALKSDVKAKYGVTLKKVGYMGISAMMHGYMVFDKSGKLLVPFRTWRNNNAEAAADFLTEKLGFHVPARWSVAHLYHAVSSGEAHVKDIDFQTTLEGYVHYRLTGEKVIGIGEASGMFPVDTEKKDYDEKLAGIFDGLTAKFGFKRSLKSLFPKVLVAGQNAGYLTKEGALYLDESGDLESGVPLCPPEGDAGTGMVATNSVRRRTGNVSAGTSVFGMIVLDKPLEKVYPEIDVVTTPVGDGVAMVHCNNCTSDLNAWVSMFDEVGKGLGAKYTANDLFAFLFGKADEGESDCGGLLSYNYVSGENITRVGEGRPLLVRTTESNFNLSNLMRAHLYSCFATLKIGIDLMREENVAVDSVVGHGGIFKTEGAPQKFLSAAVGAPVTVMKTAGEGGAWGMALLAAYSMSGAKKSLPDWLDGLFGGMEGKTVLADEATMKGFDKFLDGYKKGLPVVRLAVDALGNGEQK